MVSMAVKGSTLTYTNLVNKRGFTLIEMLVVLFVIGMIASVVAPRIVAMLDSQSKYDFRRSVMRIGAEARLLAIESGSTVRVTYNDNDRTIELSIVDDETDLEEQEKIYYLPEDVELVTFMVGRDYVASSDWIVEYYADGSGTDCGLEVQTGNALYAVMIEGADGASFLMDTLDDVSETEWEAGELEQRVQ